MKFQKFLSNKLLYLLFLLFVSLSLTKVYAIEKPTQEFYVNDYANVLSSETENYIINKSIELYNKDKTQVVVSVVNSLEGLEIEEYALQMFREFGIGDKELNNGILLLLSVVDREVRIEVGYGLEGVINDGKAGRILDNYMIPDLRNNNWDSAVKKGYDAIINELGISTSTNINGYFPYNTNTNSSNSKKGIFEICYIIFIFVFNFILALILRNTKKKKTAFLYMVFLALSAIVTNKISEDISDSFFTSFMIFLIMYFRISSASYGNSSFRSSSRSSFGGSSRGGGGSSGGGGASRRF